MTYILGLALEPSIIFRFRNSASKIPVVVLVVIAVVGGSSSSSSSWW